ncbi:MAG: bifunctional DNA primase/polymerase, partial [Sporichthyaceae bacterium]
MIAAALRYAAAGWPVFALSSTKAPLKLCGSCPPHGLDHDGEACPCLTCHGFYAASTDIEVVTAMFTGYPDRLVAIRTGAPSGLVVVDIDPRSGGLATLGELEGAGLLPVTVRQLTGGGGLHLFYAHPGGIVRGGANKLGPGVDVKADGAYVVLAPSVHPGTGRRYRWAGPTGRAPGGGRR